MVLIRLLVLITLFTYYPAFSQIKLMGAEGNIKEAANAFQVEMMFQVVLPKTVEKLTLKAIPFRGAAIHNIRTDSQSLVPKNNTELIYIEVPVSPKSEITPITLHYDVQPGKKGEIPLFFGQWQSNTSDQDFFRMRIEVSPKSSLLFPTESEIIASSQPNIWLAELPALTSMIRIEKGRQGSLWLQRVDQMVVGIFIIIGMLIWFNRKRLNYG